MAYAPAPPAPKDKQHHAWVSPSSALASQLHLPAALGTKDSGGEEEEEEEKEEEAEGQIGVEVLRSTSPNPHPNPHPHPNPKPNQVLRSAKRAWSSALVGWRAPPACGRGDLLALTLTLTLTLALTLTLTLTLT